MKVLDWNNYKDSRYLFAEHKESGETVIAYFDSVCLYWDFYFCSNSKERYKCSTNMNKEIVNKYHLEEDDDTDEINEKLSRYVENLEQLKDSKFVFHPEFEKILLGGSL